MLDANISTALERIVIFLGVDRGTVGQFDLDKGSMNVTHSYAVKGIDPLTPSINQQHVPYLTQQILEGKPFVVSRIDDLSALAATDKKFGKKLGVKSAAAVPLAAGGITLGLVSFATLREERKWSPLVVQRLQLLGEIFANALLRRKKDNELTIACAEVEKLKNRADAENDVWREQAVSQNSNEIIGKSGSLKAVMNQVLQVAPTDSTVLLLGETGTGKELLATAIHQHSQRNKNPLIRVNCASLTQTLVESELFGYEKGAFTGALNTRLGRFEIADSGTIVLDEIGELPLEVQSKLLRVLQFREFERVGSTKTRRTNVRIIASTNRDLKAMTLKGTFRQDLYYRLSVFPITVPSLRQRKEDIPLLVAYFVEQLQSRLGKTIRHIPESVIDELIAYDWPGNISEMRQCILDALEKTEKDWLTPVDLGLFKGISPDGAPYLAEPRPFLTMVESEDAAGDSYVPSALETLDVALGEAVYNLLALNSIKPLGAWMEDEVVLAVLDRYRDDMPRSAEFLHTKTRNISRWLPKIRSRDEERNSSTLWQSPRRLLREWVRESPQLAESPLQRIQDLLLAHVIKQGGAMSTANRARIMGVSTPTYLKRLRETADS